MTTEQNAEALLPALDDETLPQAIGALIFVASEAPTVAQLAEALAVPRGTIERGLTALGERLSGTGIQLQRHGETVDIVTRPEVAPWVERFLNTARPVRLSAAALETLAVIAYRQPITRAGIESIRGVNSDRALTTLLARGLVEEVGRSEGIGRPALFGTTDEFLNHFGLASLADLPPPVEEEEPPKLDVM